MCVYIYIYGYGSIPINTIFSGMNIHLPAILMFTRGTRFWHTAIYIYIDKLLQQRYLYNFKLYVFCKTLIYIYIQHTRNNYHFDKSRLLRFATCWPLKVPGLYQPLEVLDCLCRHRWFQTVARLLMGSGIWLGTQGTNNNMLISDISYFKTLGTTTDVHGVLSCS